MTIVASQLDPLERERAALKLKRNYDDFDLPHLKYWNYDPCEKHSENVSGCLQCGLIFRKHQRLGVAWLYLKQRALMADIMGPQPLDSLVLTPTGYTPMGSLQVGDVVTDPEGSASIVEQIHPRGVQPVYRVTFSDGTSAECSETHQWRVHRVGYHSSQWETMTLREIMQLPPMAAGQFPAVPLISQPVRMPEADLPIDPYLLGTLLGDGSLARSTVTLTNPDSFVVEHCRERVPAGVSVNTLSHKKRCPTYSFAGAGGGRPNPLTLALRALGLAGKKSPEKFVPEQYLHASAEQRHAMLQGLLDTDGNWTSTGAEFSSASQQLRDDVVFLARSLGFLVTVSVKENTTYTYKDQKKQGLPAYRCRIRACTELPLFRTPAKAKSYPRQRPEGERGAGTRKHWDRNQPIKWIRTIEHVRDAEVQCISVSAPSQLYVTDGFTVTHNSGKSAQAAGLLAWIAQDGELWNKKVLIVVRAPALAQWKRELERCLTDDFRVVVANGTPSERQTLYNDSDWDILLIGPEMLLRDAEPVSELPLGLMVCDDIDPLRNHKSRTAKLVKELSRHSPRTVIMTGTPLQKRLPEMHSVLEPLGGNDVFGHYWTFQKEYLKMEKIAVYPRIKGTNKRRKQYAMKVTGTKNLDIFRALVEPFYIRRTAEDLEGSAMPAVSVNNVYLDLHTGQRKAYDKLKQGVVEALNARGEQIDHVEALQKLLYGSKICASLKVLDSDLKDESSKLDWILEQLSEGSLMDEKVVIFAMFTDTIELLQKRLSKAKIGYATIWGRDRDKQARQEAQDAFWHDPDCRVLLGTQAIEQSLNLQVARHLINVDQIMNPARMAQVAGRIRRDGSEHATVYVHNLLCVDTQEDHYLEALEKEQALSDFIWQEESDLFESLSAKELLRLISS